MKSSCKSTVRLVVAAALIAALGGAGFGVHRAGKNRDESRDHAESLVGRVVERLDRDRDGIPDAIERRLGPLTGEIAERVVPMVIGRVAPNYPLQKDDDASVIDLLRRVLDREDKK